MVKKNGYASLLICYLLWGFQPLYWNLLKGTDSLTLLGMRIVFAAVFSVAILAVQGRAGELKAALTDKKTMKYLVTATIFLLADWAVFIIAVNSGHVLDASLGYYICPLVMFSIGVAVFREKAEKLKLAALGIAVIGVLVSAVSIGSIPVISLVLAVNWAVYSSVKKNVKSDGVVSIAVETLLLTPFAVAFLLIYSRAELAAADGVTWVLLVCSGIVTALPMFLFSNCVSALPLLVMCFATYLSPSFNLLCGFLMGESFTKTQLISFSFFIAAILVFTYAQIKSIKNPGQ